MAAISYFSILPSDIIQYLSQSLNTTNFTRDPVRLLRLPHPRTGLAALFLPLEWLSPSVPEHSSTILEVQSVSPPDERSWMLGEEFISNGSLLTMTMIDPAFLLLPILQSLQSGDSSTVQFRTADDLLDESAKRHVSSVELRAQSSPESQDVLDFCSLRCARKALVRLCEVKEISSEIMVYRFSKDKSLEYMRLKVSNLQISAALDASRTTTRSLAKDGLMEDGKEELLQLGRTRFCCDLIAHYLAPNMRDELLKSYNFDKLQKFFNQNQADAVARTAAAPSKVKSEAKTTKATTNDKKRKTKNSRGVEELKKVNTNGMAKLSSFFNKA